MEFEAACKHCQSTNTLVLPAEVRVYLNVARSVSVPPISPAPDIMMCLECGWSEFKVSAQWLAARWLRRPATPARPKWSSVEMAGD